MMQPLLVSAARATGLLNPGVLMATSRARNVLLPVVACTLILGGLGCGGIKAGGKPVNVERLDGGSDTGTGGSVGTGGSTGGGVGGSGGSAGSAGTGGGSASDGAAGAGGTTVTSDAGDTGAAGTMGMAGTSGTAGTTGAAGTTGTGGTPATGGTTGTGGTPATGGATGTGGTPATGGATGTGGTPATGGTTGTGGTPATGGTTGTGGTGTPPGPEPGLCGARICPAVSVLLAACQPAGGCNVAPDGLGTRACYDNGVKVIVTPNPLTASVRFLVTRPDGVTPCYKLDIGAFLPGGGQLVEFRDGDGAVLSRGVLGANGRLTLTCEDVDTELAPECTPVTRAGVCSPGTCR
jgi:hypothetical protein